jgi:WD40 repeat protein
MSRQVSLSVRHFKAMRMSFLVSNYSADGKPIVSDSSYKTVRIWDIFEGWADVLCHKLESNMSRKEWHELISPDIDYIE